jgi:hypothetical protein
MGNYTIADPQSASVSVYREESISPVVEKGSTLLMLGGALLALAAVSYHRRIL